MAVGGAHIRPSGLLNVGQGVHFAVGVPSCLGALHKLRLHVAAGSVPWHLECIVITNKDDGTTTWFYCGAWIGGEHGQERLLTACSSDPRQSLVGYSIVCHTSDLRGAASDLRVLVEVTGAMATADRPPCGDLHIAGVCQVGATSEHLPADVTAVLQGKPASDARVVCDDDLPPRR